MPVLSLAVLAAGVWCVGALAFQWSRMKAYGRRKPFSAPAGSARAGIWYAFTSGLAPNAKESVREHRPSYVAGLGLHLGVFTALALLAWDLGGLTVPDLLVWPVRGALGAGFTGGLFLLLKRVFKAELRGLSHPDDFLSNLAVTAFVGLALVGPTPAWKVSAGVLLVIAPLGKIRHCLFFFSTRAAFGAFFGRRGVLPAGGSHGR